MTPQERIDFIEDITTALLIKQESFDEATHAISATKIRKEMGA